MKKILEVSRKKTIFENSFVVIKFSTQKRKKLGIMFGSG